MQTNVTLGFSWRLLVTGLALFLATLAGPTLAQETRTRAGATSATTAGPAQGGAISGKIVDDETGEPLAGVNVAVVGTVLGTVTGSDGSFALGGNLRFPVTLRISYVGYSTQTVEVTQAGARITVNLQVEGVQANEVVVSASRIQETILEAPVSIEKFDQLAVRQTASSSYYQGLTNLKGVDVATSSIGFQIINTRGFNSTGNTRIIQLIDGMDTQAPALNFPVGNLNGPSELDIASIEFLPGASSALYGPAAFNGAVVMTSKNPFDYQGLSATYKIGVNHVGEEPGIESPVPYLPNPDADVPTSLLHDFSIRYAKAFNDKFAFKVALSYFQANDWRGTDVSDRESERQNDLSFNPGYDGIHVFGDEASTNLQLLAQSSAFQAAAGSLGLAPYLPVTLASTAQVVARTGYSEAPLIDYDVFNIKLAGALHYRITNNLEASVAYNGGFGTSIYTGAQRYSLRNFGITQVRAELKADEWFVRAYTTREESRSPFIESITNQWFNKPKGGSYIADFAGFSIGEQSLDSETWFATYGLNYLGALAAAGVAPGTPSFLIPAATRGAAHEAARAAADATRINVGDPGFGVARANAISAPIPAGAQFNDESLIWHYEGQYDLKKILDPTILELQVGASYRQYRLRSNGTIFDEGGEDVRTIYEYGAYVQATKRLINDRLRLTGSLRYDDHENFEGQVNPRLSAVITVAENHNIRVSYQTGFRFPPTQGQWIDLDALSSRLLGGLPELSEKYGLDENTFTTASVDRFNATVLAGAPDPSLLRRWEVVKVKPERIQSLEVGYKSLINGKLFIDAAVFGNRYKDFINQVFVTQYPLDPLTNPAVWGAGFVQTSANTYFPYANSGATVFTYGAAVGFDYSLPSNFTVGVNYNFNRFDRVEDVTDEDLDAVDAFNTPEHKVNLSFGNRKIAKQGSFNITWRWQDAFLWESSFATAPVKAINTIDAQFSWKVPQAKTIFKLGGQNLLNYRHVTNAGGPLLGAIYYLQVTFDQFLN